MNKESQNNHKVCPECGSKKIESTCVGYILGADKDMNNAVCKCGWKGVVHDLKPDDSKENKNE